MGQIGVTLAYSFAAAKDISIFAYASIIFTAILGFILFGESPDFYATLGYVVIIGASYYMFEKARRDAKIIKNKFKGALYMAHGRQQDELQDITLFRKSRQYLQF